ncbi:MAG: hypothetical protein CBE11_01770 [Rickettsiales bacterium TMED251]|nr:MAG: hypothetical protein CBE11_01770 [Rickettsiales bacterium TMED251]
MKNKIILVIIFILINTNLYSDRFMMNCISPDRKNATFYKLDNTKKENKLFVRSMKGRWSDFCEQDIDINKKVKCFFKELSVIRLEEEIQQDLIIKSKKSISFSNYELIEKKEEYKKNENNASDGSVEKVFECRKIRL